MKAIDTTAASKLSDPGQVLLGGPLGLAGGVAVFAGLPDPATCHALTVEAWDAYSQATRQEKVEPDDEDGRGGTPPRSLLTSSGSTVQDAFYAAPWLHAFLTEQCGVPIVPSGNRGSYSYYVQPGDFLDTHLDIFTCDVTLITVLHDDTDPGDAGGGLAVYRNHIALPLSHLRAAPNTDAVLVKATTGQSIVILGGLVPHRVVPLGSSGQRVISALCFQARVAI